MTDYKEIIYEAIHDAWAERLETIELESCIREAMFVGVDICRAFKLGVVESLPSEQDVLDALASGAYYALGHHQIEIENGQTNQEDKKITRQRRTRYKKVAQDG